MMPNESAGFHFSWLNYIMVEGGWVGTVHRDLMIRNLRFFFEPIPCGYAVSHFVVEFLLCWTEATGFIKFMIVSNCGLTCQILRRVLGYVYECGYRFNKEIAIYTLFYSLHLIFLDILKYPKHLALTTPSRPF